MTAVPAGPETRDEGLNPRRIVVHEERKQERVERRVADKVGSSQWVLR